MNLNAIKNNPLSYKVYRAINDRRLRKAALCDQDIACKSEQELLPDERALLKASRGLALIITHSFGGGAGKFAINLRDSIASQGRSCAVIMYVPDRHQYRMTFLDSSRNICICSERLENLFELPACVSDIYINELVSYPDLFHTQDLLAAFAEKSGARLTFYVHDYYCICDSTYLLNENTVYCGIPEDSACERCGKYTCVPVEWRKNWYRFLSKMNQVVVFSRSSESIMNRVYPDLPLSVRPHTVEKLEPLPPHEQSDKLTIALLGTLTQPKGLKIAEEMCRIIERASLPIRILLIGFSTEREITTCPCFSQTGFYARDQLPSMVRKHKIDLFFIASVCPETYCFTADEAMMFGLPVACFNVGATPERVSRYSKGIVIQDISAKAALKKIGDYFGKKLFF